LGAVDPGGQKKPGSAAQGLHAPMPSVEYVPAGHSMGMLFAQEQPAGQTKTVGVAGGEGEGGTEGEVVTEGVEVTAGERLIVGAGELERVKEGGRVTLKAAEAVTAMEGERLKLRVADAVVLLESDPVGEWEGLRLRVMDTVPQPEGGAVKEREGEGAALREKAGLALGVGEGWAEGVAGHVSLRTVHCMLSTARKAPAALRAMPAGEFIRAAVPTPSTPAPVVPSPTKVNTLPPPGVTPRRRPASPNSSTPFCAQCASTSPGRPAVAAGPSANRGLPLPA
jgi:hypothetical protein